jgi:hypothetical protein
MVQKGNLKSNLRHDFEPPGNIAPNTIVDSLTNPIISMLVMLVMLVMVLLLLLLLLQGMGLLLLAMANLPIHRTAENSIAASVAATNLLSQLKERLGYSISSSRM